MIVYRAEQISLYDLALEFWAWRWPLGASPARPAWSKPDRPIDDHEPDIPGSLNEVVLDYDLGQRTDAN